METTQNKVWVVKLSFANEEDYTYFSNQKSKHLAIAAAVRKYCAINSPRASTWITKVRVVPFKG